MGIPPEPPVTLEMLESADDLSLADLRCLYFTWLVRMLEVHDVEEVRKATERLISVGIEVRYLIPPLPGIFFDRHRKPRPTKASEIVPPPPDYPPEPLF